MLIKPFPTSHDCAGSVGYTVTTSDGVKISLATDTGVITDEIYQSVAGSDAVIIESNHDVVC